MVALWVSFHLSLPKDARPCFSHAPFLGLSAIVQARVEHAMYVGFDAPVAPIPVSLEDYALLMLTLSELA